jgi:RNA polymerase sigma factor (TIGR02999 family)
VTPDDRDRDRPAAGAAETTALLAAARAGDRAAYDRVFARVYDELSRVASRQAARLGASESMSTSVLVHEAYLKLAGSGPAAGNDRGHFFALAARAMRQILIDHARHRGRKKRGAAAAHVDLDRVELAAGDDGAPQVEELIALDRALSRLAAVDAELARLVEWRFFAGLTLEEIAAMTAVSERTLKRQWQVARAFLLRELAVAGAEPDGSADGNRTPAAP